MDTCPYCGANVASGGDIFMCDKCGNEICECCNNDHGCEEE